MEKNDEGFTLVECMVAIGLVLVMATIGIVNVLHAQSPMIRSHDTLLQSIEEARQIALNSAGESNGALLVITPQTHGTALLVLRGRPIDGYTPPSLIPGLTPIHIDAQLSLGNPKLHAATLAFAPSGHVDLIPYPVTPNWPPIARGPGCGTNGESLAINLHLSTRDETLQLDCIEGSSTTDQRTPDDKVVPSGDL